jgi:hypothetical protein
LTTLIFCFGVGSVAAASACILLLFKPGSRDYTAKASEKILFVAMSPSLEKLKYFFQVLSPPADIVCNKMSCNL